MNEARMTRTRQLVGKAVMPESIAFHVPAIEGDGTDEVSVSLESLKAIGAGSDTPPWVPVSTPPPDTGPWIVNVPGIRGEFFTSFDFYDGHRGWRRYKNITHYQPLPAPTEVEQ